MFTRKSMPDGHAIHAIRSCISVFHGLRNELHLGCAAVLDPLLILLRNWHSAVIVELQITANKHFHWFKYNHLKANPSKSQLLLCTKAPINVSTSDVPFTISTAETLFGIIIDSELSFDQYLSSICSKASKKLHARKSSKISLFWLQL